MAVVVYGEQWECMADPQIGGGGGSGLDGSRVLREVHRLGLAADVDAPVRPGVHLRVRMALCQPSSMLITWLFERKFTGR